MKLYWILLTLVSIFLFLFLSDNSEAAPACAFRSGSCNAGEVCIFSVFQENNTHIGNCSYYSTQVCCNGTTRVAVRSDSCNSDEGIVLSVFQENNTHVGHRDYYSTKVCARFANNPVVVNTRSSCQSGETCIASKFQDNNSHVGTCAYYDNDLCLRERLNVTITVGVNNSEPSWNDVVRATGRATRADDSNIDTNANDLNIYLNSTLYCTNETDSNGDYICDFSAPGTLGIYTLNVTIVDPTTSITWTNTSVSITVKASVGLNATAASEAESVSCYEEPRVIQNPDGTLRIGYVRVCVSK